MSFDEAGRSELILELEIRNDLIAHSAFVIPPFFYIAAIAG